MKRYLSTYETDHGDRTRGLVHACCIEHAEEQAAQFHSKILPETRRGVSQPEDTDGCDICGWHYKTAHEKEMRTINEILTARLRGEDCTAEELVLLKKAIRVMRTYFPLEWGEANAEWEELQARNRDEQPNDNWRID